MRQRVTDISRGGGEVSTRQVLTLEIAGSNPAPATMTFLRKEEYAETTTAVGVVELMKYVDALSGLMTSVWTIMMANPLLAVMLAGALVTVGIRLFKRIKAAAK